MSPTTSKTKATEDAPASESSLSLTITLVKSLIGRPDKHRRIINGLGLYKTNQTVKQADSPTIRGMIAKVSHLINVEAA